MKPKSILCLLAAALLSAPLSSVLAGPAGLDVFGFFQGSFYSQRDLQTSNHFNTFTTQQLNLFLQKDLRKRWSVFINFEFTNSYSSYRNWGSFSLEEAWIKYRHNKYLTLKLGLLIPIYNDLNEIKNRTPLLPYIIRPLVYETSFQETIPISEFVPEQAYVQAYGYVPIRDFKFDYALYFGNSPNIATDPSQGDTGLDTTATFLVGGRIGLRHSAFKVGFSTTADRTNRFKGLESEFGRPPNYFDLVPRYRGGFDLSFEIRDFSFASEVTGVSYDEQEPNLDIDMSFFFMTIGYTFWDRLFAYVSFWEMRFNSTMPSTSGFTIAEIKMEIPNVGVAYSFSDRIKFKGMIATGTTDSNVQGLIDDKFKFYGLAVSVAF